MATHPIRMGIMSRQEAAGQHPDAMLSIVDPGESPASWASHQMTLEMHDLDEPEPSRPDLIAPNREHARKIADFAREIEGLAQDRPLTVIVHCSAGISRSPAAAIGVLAALHPDRGPDWARQRVDRMTHGTAEPNQGLLKALDAELGWSERERTADTKPARPRKTPQAEI
mgnify:FL=1